MKDHKSIPPALAQKLLISFLKDDLAEEVLGDLEQKFYITLKTKSHLKAKLNYWYQAMHYMRPFAIKKLKSMPEVLVTDALLDQTVFSGVGNIIKNEVLYRVKVHPLSKVGCLPPRKLTQLITEASNYSYDFLRWKKEYTLRKHWLAHTKKTCQRDGGKIVKEYLAMTDRRTFYCEKCQIKYD